MSGRAINISLSRSSSVRARLPINVEGRPSAVAAACQSPLGIEGRASQRGFTLLEVIVTITILTIMSAAAIPILKNTVRSQREAEFREDLRELRGAIDRYHRFYELNPQSIPIQERTDSGYPRSLQILVDGFVPANQVSGKKVRFLRKIPIDPMTGNADWGIRSFDDEPGSTGGGGEDVFDVFTRSNNTALNDTKYRDW